MKKIIIRTLRSIQEALFPPKCLECGFFFDPDSLEGDTDHGASWFDSPDEFQAFKTLTGQRLCKKCIESFDSVGEPSCMVCGVRFLSRQGEDRVCGECITKKKKISRARASGIYDFVLKNLIIDYKYGGNVDLSGPLGKLLYFTLIKNYDVRDIDVIIPVPLHRKRFRSRGFNQSYLLIRKWAEYSQNNGISEFPVIKKNLLTRQKYTKAQANLNKKSRRENLKGAFKVRNTTEVTGLKILIVDDVYTTGATAEECAGVLLAAGADDVYVLTLATSVLV